MDLLPPPDTHSFYGELVVAYPKTIAENFNKLSSVERIALYYFWRASLAGNLISADQHHRDSLTITRLFETIVGNEKLLGEPWSRFLSQAKIYLVYLWANHCHYFAPEHANNKRTPEQLGLDLITCNTTHDALELVDQDMVKELELVKKSLFDPEYQPTLTVPNSIEQSAVNFYQCGFTQLDYDQLTPSDKERLNAYFYSEQTAEGRIAKTQLYSATAKYNQELTVAIFWLSKAHDYCAQHPEQFDEHFVRSLDLLIRFLQSGNEELFRQHSIEWLQTNSRIDYTFGFIETYADPKNIRGMFQAEVTVKTMTLEQLAHLLPSIEQALPFDPAFKRKSTGTFAHASINCQIFGMGDLGPLRQTLAYCLPNYEDIRSDYGSKQIIYQPEKSLSEIINAELAQELQWISVHGDWLAQHDPHHRLVDDIDMLQTILHETIGHASGALAHHTFRAGDNLAIDGLTHQIGQTIEVTDANLKLFLEGFDQTLEELRAEIIALYVSVFHLDELLTAGSLKNWTHLPKKKLIDWCILVMAYAGLKRFIRQPDDAEEMSGDHARANHTITSYLIEHGALELVWQTKEIGKKNYQVPGLVIVNQEQAKKCIRDLVILVQTIKSTGDGQEALNLVTSYGIPIKDRKLFDAIKSNHKAIVGNFKAMVSLYPLFELSHDANGQPSSCRAYWPETIFEQFFHYKKLELKTQ